MSTQTPETKPGQNRIPEWAVQAVVAGQLALIGAAGVTRLVAQTHATIRRAPLPWQHKATATAAEAPLPYQLVTRSFLWLAQLLRRLSPETVAAGGLFRSALNGVVGDTLEAVDNPLAQDMQICDEDGQPLSPADWAGAGRRGAVLFVHGLCLSEREWQTFAHQGCVRELREFGYSVAWVRYNTGRPIPENGAALSALLDAAVVARRTGITLVGHSMGGLVIRSASHLAARNEAPWLAQLRNAAYLGTPHQGAPLERLGHAANSLLALTPYTRPFMQLGDVRSSGIRDLRHGRISPDDDNPVQLAAHARHLLLAGHLGSEGSRHWLGDGLVPVRSALGQHVEGDRALAGESVTRVEFAKLGHMAMLGDERVHRTLLQWLIEE